MAQNPLLGDITCGCLLQQLQHIWDEVGESDEQRDKMLLQLEQECLDVYKRKVDHATESRALLLQLLADSKSELTSLLSSLGEKTLVNIPDKSSDTIKEQLADIAPALERLLKKKEDRIKELSDVQLQIQKILAEISGNVKFGDHVKPPTVDESDLTLKKLDEFQAQLQELQKEKSDRLQKVFGFVSTIHDFCAVLGLDFFSTIVEVHPSLNDSVDIQSKSISNDTLSKLGRTVQSLKEEKKSRLEKLQHLATQLTDLWHLMDTATEERNLFDHVTCNIYAKVEDVTTSGALAIDLIEQAEIEVERLDNLKASKMKEIALKKQAELEEIYVRAHIEIDSAIAHDKIMAIVDSGNVEPSELFTDMDDQIQKAKQEALSRKEILEKVEKWMSACEEESWLEDYNRDDNRYSSSRGAHLNLKRAEKARVLVNRIPALVDALVAKSRAWEDDHDMSFTYDGVPLLAMLDEYSMLRQDREEEKRKTRDQKKFTEQVSSDHETAFGSRISPPSSSRPLGQKKVVGPRANGSVSNGTPSVKLSGSTNQSTGSNVKSAAGRSGKRDGTRSTTPANSVATSKEGAAASHVSGEAPVPSTP